MAELFWPFDPAIINYGFGYPAGYGGFHNGIDFPVGQGTELRATVSGTILNNDAGSVDCAGVDIMTSDGWKVRMWHVSKFLVPNGSQVAAGDVVALSGGQPGTWGAGNASGPHLHWGVATDGRDGWVDPSGLNPKMFDNSGDKIDDEDDEMIFVARMSDTGSAYLWNTATGGVQPIPALDQYEVLVRGFKVFAFNDWGQFETMRGWYGEGMKIPTTDLSNVQINVDAIAQAIADKIQCGSGTPCVTTKADIIDSITANYPEDK